MEIVLRNQPDDRQKLLSALEAFANEHHLPHSVHHAADLALEEHLTNITRYAYDAARAHDVVVRFGIELDCLAIQVEDEGNRH